MTRVFTDTVLAADIAEGLARVKTLFESQLTSPFPAVNDLCRHVERYRGKMLRPTLVLVSGLAFTRETESLRSEHSIIAATVEMIHMATLVHDDVLDDAQVRRRGETVNFLRGNEAAVMLGDYLISNAFHLCSRAHDPALNLRLGEVTNTLCEGELVQLSRRHDLSLDENTYFEIVRRKTAVLVGASCELGAQLAGASTEDVVAMRQFGEHLGVAFQIQDDLLDLLGDEATVGKSILRDLEKGKLTLPMILHIARTHGAPRARALEAIEAKDSVALRDALTASGSIDAARAKAVAIVEEAKRGLPQTQRSHARELLLELADRIVARDA
ncbi:MAG: polyprenyl synthetase family protein [Planctomycetota bacterium]|nr:MAG: polyprenyl synthetase family protein [Planctomycetota bacterium]RLS95017.1 MAG: polyprenyl synthetase family protein [Planctomycetota bacterium]